MDENLARRRLVAILMADAAGYSRLMAAQESATLGALKSHREFIDRSIAAHHGRIAGSAGDSVLAEFASPVAAVICAVAIQAELKQRNEGTPAHRRLEFRIGINLGDVIDDGTSIYGDGVNVAARLQGLADAGAILIAASVREQVRGKVDCDFADEGWQRVKNIPRRLRVYKVVPRPSGGPAPARWRGRPLALGALAVAAAALALTWWFGPWRRPSGTPSPPAVVESFKDCADCPELVAIPAGTGKRGSSRDEPGHEPSEGPVTDIVIARPFALGRYEITFAHWDDFARAGGAAEKPTDRGWGRGNRPVIYVNWNDVTEYLAWLSLKTGKRYRLPSEAEWEYAARAGTTTVYPWGDDMAAGMANCSGCGDGLSDKTLPVGSFPPNRFGLHDMLGNVWEWTADCWNGSYAGAPTDGSPWQHGECDMRTVRGGAWGQQPADLRVAKRLGDKTELRSGRRGFRVARDWP